MSIFGSIMTKIFHHGSDATPAAAPTPEPAMSTGVGAAPETATPTAPTPAMPATPVDVGAVLSAMAAQKGGGGNYSTSIVDLLKLLDLDSSMAARHQLAEELGVHAGADGTAEENIALHKAVMAKLAENGGTVPASMKG